MRMGGTLSTMATNSTWAAASAAPNTLMSPNESVPLTGDGNAISRSARNEPRKDQTSIAQKEGNHMSESSVQDILSTARALEGKAVASQERWNYTNEETERLLSMLSRHPTNKEWNWSIAQRDFNAAAPPGTRYRNAESLYQKWQMMKMAAYIQYTSHVEGTSVQETELAVEGNSGKESATKKVESNVRKRPIKEGGEKSGNEKKQRTGGVVAEYTKEEFHRLMVAVAIVQPGFFCGNWEHVKQHFDQNAPLGLPSSAPNRTASSLWWEFTLIATSKAIREIHALHVKINLAGAETLATEDNADNDVIGVAPADNKADGEEPVGDESATSKLRMVSVEMPPGVLEGDAGAKSDPPETVDTPSDHDATDHEADRLLHALIAFFERFNPDDGMIAGNECRDAIFSRLDNLERNMRVANIKLGTIVSCVQSDEALERARQWLA